MTAKKIQRVGNCVTLPAPHSLDPSAHESWHECAVDRLSNQFWRCPTGSIDLHLRVPQFTARLVHDEDFTFFEWVVDLLADAGLIGHDSAVGTFYLTIDNSSVDMRVTVLPDGAPLVMPPSPTSPGPTPPNAPNTPPRAPAGAMAVAA